MKPNKPQSSAVCDLEAALNAVTEEGVSKDMFRALVEKSTDIIVITGADLGIRYITGSVEQVLGAKPEAILGKKLFDFVELADVARLQKIVKGENIQDHTFTEVGLSTTEGARKYFDVTISNLLNNNKVNGLVVNLHDITSRKMAEEKLLKANNELDQFIYKTSHDLRAPLLTAIGLVELAESDPDRNQYEYLKMIRESLMKLDSFIEDINSFYRNEKLAIRKERIDLESILKDEINNLRGAKGTSHKVDITYDVTRVSELYSDSIRLRTVITNVLSNAIKYSDRYKSSYVKIDVQVTPDTCIMKVEDNGIGIRKKYLNNIFDIFYRADENAKGSGLGLYIVKDTVDKLNGQIEVQSEYGKGTAFTITIPNFLNLIEELGCN